MDHMAVGLLKLGLFYNPNDSVIKILKGVQLTQNFLRHSSGQKRGCHKILEIYYAKYFNFLTNFAISSIQD